MVWSSLDVFVFAMRFFLTFKFLFSFIHFVFFSFSLFLFMVFDNVDKREMSAKTESRELSARTLIEQMKLDLFVLHCFVSRFQTNMMFFLFDLRYALLAAIYFLCFPVCLISLSMAIFKNDKKSYKKRQNTFRSFQYFLWIPSILVWEKRRRKNQTDYYRCLSLPSENVFFHTNFGDQNSGCLFTKCSTEDTTKTTIKSNAAVEIMFAFEIETNEKRNDQFA